MNRISRWIALPCAVFGLGLMSGTAVAFEAPPVSEPGILSLLGMGMVVILVAAIRNRRK